jgi:aspartyl-tRNA(Asn)/glutamyl-tRNA(Gln) amidotransferase subunit A
MYLADIFTVQANLSGMPCISIPYGKDKQNLPIGIQLMANQFEEHELFAFAGDLI